MQKINLLVPAGHIPSLDAAARAISNIVEWNWLAFSDQAGDSGHKISIDAIISFLGQKACDFVVLPDLAGRFIQLIRKKNL